MKVIKPYLMNVLEVFEPLIEMEKKLRNLEQEISIESKKVNPKN